ncbi:MAG: hypothetical protein ACTSU4_07440 [Promethearchaeota archaeon]
MSINFPNLGPLLGEQRTPAVCEACGSYIWKQIYYCKEKPEKQKVVFVCKTCLQNKK